MNLQIRTDGEFLEMVDRSKEIHLEKLIGMQDEFITDCFADYKELLLEELQGQLKQLQAEVGQKVSGSDTYDELRRQADSWEISGFVNSKTSELCQTFGKKKKICANAVLRLILGADTDDELVTQKAGQTDFKMKAAVKPDLSEQEELHEICRKKSCLNEEIEKTVKEKEEAETAFRELVRKNAEIRAKMETEKPEIKYMTRRVRREGFFGFLVDLIGKARTETITDDSEYRGWQERVAEVQRAYDAKAREENDQIEKLKNEWHQREEEYDQLDTAQKQLEKKFKEQIKKGILEELEVFLYGEGGVFDQEMAGIESDFRLSAEKIRELVWKEYQNR